MTLLPVAPAYRLAERAEEQRWLVASLWSEQAVGIIGGEPKCCKSFLALDLAVSVAAGTPCLRRFPVPRPGRVLLYAAEDALHIVRQRLEGICFAAGLALSDLDVQVITAPTVRLDLEIDRKALDATIAKLAPRLLVLDPFVRLHRIDENASGEVAPLLAYLRELQRRHGVAVIVVHHAKKGAGRARAGQALRGSSEFHAWGDSNLYLRRNGDPHEGGDLTLTVEHRAAASIPTLSLELAQRANALALEVVERQIQPTPPYRSVDERITAALSDADHPIPFAELRGMCRVRTASLYARLAALIAAGRLVKSDHGYRLTTLSIRSQSS
jgi:RecA-family ATPase